MNNKEIPTWEEKEQELNDNLLFLHDVMKKFQLVRLTVIQQMRLGNIPYLEVGIDVQPPKGRGCHSVKYAFPEKEIESLTTWEDIERKVGCELLTTEEAAEYFPVGRRKLQTLLGKGYYEDLYFKVWDDFIPTKNARQHGMRYPKYVFPKKWLEEGDILNRHHLLFNYNKHTMSDYFVAQSRGVSLDTLLEEIEKGVWTDAIIDQKVTAKDRTMYIFDKKKMMHCSPNHSLNMIALHIKEKPSLLEHYVTDGSIKQPERFKGTNLYCLEEVKKEVLEIKNRRYNKRMKGVFKKPIEYLEDHQNEIIERYLDHREKGRQIIWEDKKYFKPEPMRNADSSRKVYGRIISNAVFKMMMHRCGIPVVENGKSRNVNHLSDSELHTLSTHLAKKEFLRDLLISEDDFRAYEKGLKDYTVWSNSQIIKPFLYWLLMQVEKEYPLWRVDIEESRTYHKRRHVLIGAVNYLPASPPKKASNYKVYLTRSKIIQVYQAFFNLNQLPRGSHEKGLKYATMWMCSHFLSLRPEEIHNVRIEHFVLDEEGFLKTVNQKGYGLMVLPAEASKQEVSPSHPVLKTLVVPRLVKLINTYLKYLYEFQEVRGVGYLFRPIALRHHTEQKSISNNNVWVKQYKQYFDFLTPKEREHFIFKTGRHSLYNLFRKTGLKPQLEDHKVRAAEIQMRHDIKMKSGTMGENHYMEDIDPVHYLNVVDEVLNYPWDLDELSQWEKEKGYRVIGSGEIYQDLSQYGEDVDPTPVVNEKRIENETPAATIDTSSIEEELFRLRRNPAKKLGMSAIERSQTIKRLNEKLERLKSS